MGACEERESGLQDAGFFKIGKLFNIKAYSTVSSILRRVARLQKYDRKIKKQIGKIQDSINNGQKQNDPYFINKRPSH